MKITNKLNLPSAIVQAVDVYRRSPNSLSATTLLKGVKEILLTDRHYDELTDDVSDRIWAIFGQAVHSILEKDSDKGFNEVSVSYDVKGIRISGRIDHYNMADGIIEDWKTASIWKITYQDFTDWRRQGLIYAWLLKVNGMDVKKCRFTALLKDHSKSKARFDSSYPQKPVYVYEFDVTEESITEIENFIGDKVSEYLEQVNYTDDDIFPCSQDERWAGQTKYACMKKGRKSAVKLFDNEDECQAMVDTSTDYYKAIRPGESKKCLDYCLVKDYCNFYKTLKGDNDDE